MTKVFWKGDIYYNNDEDMEALVQCDEYWRKRGINTLDHDFRHKYLEWAMNPIMDEMLVNYCIGTRVHYIHEPYMLIGQHEWYPMRLLQYKPTLWDKIIYRICRILEWRPK